MIAHKDTHNRVMRMRPGWLGVVGGALLGLSVASYGATPTPPGALSFTRALALALAHQPGLAARRDEASAALRLAQASKAVFFPHLGLHAGVMVSGMKNDIPDFTTANGRREITAQVVLDQALFDPRATAAIAAAQAGAEFAHYRVLHDRFAVAAMVARTYYTLQRQHAAIAIWKLATTQSRADLDAARQGLRAGVRTRLDLLRLQTALRQARQELTQVRLQHSTSARLLMLMTGLSTLPALATPLPIRTTFTLPSLTRIQRAALHRQPALAMARSQRRRAAALLAGARAARWPRAQLQAAYGWDTLNAPGAIPAGWSAGVSVSMPLFNAGELRDRAGAARLRLSAARAHALQIRLDLRASINTVWGNARAALDAYRTSRGLAQTKQQIWQISREGYRAGRLSSLDLLLAQRDWVHGQQAELANAARLRLALVRLRLLTGQLPTDNTQ